MACIFNTVLLDLTAAMTDSFEGRGAYSRGVGLLEDLQYTGLCKILVSCTMPSIEKCLTFFKK